MAEAGGSRTSRLARAARARLGSIGVGRLNATSAQAFNTGKKVKGWIYVISNDAMPGLVKVGYSTNDPELRASALTTGAPHPYVVDYEAEVKAPKNVEKKVHRLLSAHREGHEWFRCSPEFAVSVIRQVIGDSAIVERFKRVNRARAEALLREIKEAARNIEEKKSREREIEILWQEQEKWIRAKYEHQVQQTFSRLSVLVYVVGVLGVALIGLTFVAPKLSVDQRIFDSVIIGVIGGLLTKSWHKKRQESSQMYQTILKQRDEEIASVRNLVISCPKCGQNLRIPREKNLAVTCPACGHQFAYPTPRPDTGSAGGASSTDQR